MSLTTVTPTIVKDLCLVSNAADTNQNGNPIDVDYSGNNRHGLWDFGDISTIPVGATITTAPLSRTYDVDTAGVKTGTFKPLLRDFSETLGTYNKYDGTNAWTTAGAVGSSDVSSSGNVVLDMPTGSSSGTDISELKDLVQWVLDNQPTHLRFLHKVTVEGSTTISIRYKDRTVSAPSWPITYRDPAATITSKTIDSLGRLVLVFNLSAQSWNNAATAAATNYTVSLTRAGATVNLTGVSASISTSTKTATVTVTLNGTVLSTDTSVTCTVAASKVTDDDGHTNAAVSAGSTTNSSSQSAFGPQITQFFFGV